MGLTESTSISQQQQKQIFPHPVFDNHNLDVIDLTSEDDVINSHYSSPAVYNILIYMYILLYYIMLFF